MNIKIRKTVYKIIYENKTLIFETYTCHVDSHCAKSAQIRSFSWSIFRHFSHSEQVSEQASQK